MGGGATGSFLEGGSSFFSSVSFIFSNTVGDGGGAGAGRSGCGGIFSDAVPPKLTEDDMKPAGGDRSAG